MFAPTKTMPRPIDFELYFHPSALERGPLPVVSSSQRAFKKHKVLPHPRHTDSPRPPPRRAVDIQAPSRNPGTQRSNPPAIEPGRRVVSGPTLPPTPPAHPRAASSSSAALSTRTANIETSAKKVATAATTAPETPPSQQNPPTPDGTPPEAVCRQQALRRPSQTDCIPSKTAAADSRADSFRTARENQSSSDEGKILAPANRPRVRSEASARNTRRTIDVSKQETAQGSGPGPRLSSEQEEGLTPRAKQDFQGFDGKWGSEEEGGKECDDTRTRNVANRKRRAHTISSQSGRGKVAKGLPVTTTNAIQSTPLQERPQTAPTPSRELVGRGKHRATQTTSESTTSTDVKRSSGMSSKSTVSTVVEAIVVDAPVQRQQTLRHVKKHTELREPGPDHSPARPANAPKGLEKRRRRRPQTAEGARAESLASCGTVNSLPSRKSRREVWKNGGVPVVVIPDRISSMNSTRTPSLRSTSSRRSQRSNSMGSVPLLHEFRGTDLTPYFDRPSRRGRPVSVGASIGSLPGDQRTMDYPPIVPMRSSSLSATTSRNASRAASHAGSRSGSLTTASLKAHNALQEQQTSLPPPKATVERDGVPSVEYITPERDHADQTQRQPARAVESHHRPLVDHNGDPFLGKRLTGNTPFSQASVETYGTHSAAEVSEAMAVSIFPHQNKSVLVVNHTSPRSTDANASREISTEEDETTKHPVGNEPKIASTGSGGGPVTPPQPRPQLCMNDVGSPFRNPRVPPEPTVPPVPPAINFIPATPSGLTPSTEKMRMLGNYFEDNDKRPSLVKRALSLGKTMHNTSHRPGFLSRTLSLSRNRKDTSDSPRPAKGRRATMQPFSRRDDSPADDSRLHPLWLPSPHMVFEEDEDCIYDLPEDHVYRDPPAKNGPSPPRRRSISQQMKHTFAILPVSDEEHYTAADSFGTERRTIKRTPSGNLRVMRQRDSSSSSMRGGRPCSPVSSHRRSQSAAAIIEGARPQQAVRSSTMPPRPGRHAWGIDKRVDSRGRRFFPGWQDKIEQYGFQNLQRRLSEHKRQKRTDALRQKISGPREVRDGLGEVMKRDSYKGPSYVMPSVNGGSLPRAGGIEAAKQVQVQV